MNVFVSPFQNPFINLALEDHFLRGGADLPLAFFYVNRPSVVLGRFQNPWLECNLPYLVENDIWMVRRQSGGGCVFHDEGNLNYSFIYPEGMINRGRGVELLKKAFAQAEIHLEISPRHDLWLDGKKISGSAFKQTKDASFHHGTFLISSDMDKLNESLKHTIIPKETKSIASVRSQVIKLQDKFPGVEIQDVIELVSHEIKTTPQLLDSSLLSLPEVQKSFRDLTDWQWLWGETPLFTWGELSIHKGLVKEPFEA
ncbi:MAG: lipoate--protein ligase family protein, partial [Bdellovibrionales bacterium]|nr:lipoate--protein ligase family protein [Bdellovibrionales bacterium]